MLTTNNTLDTMDRDELVRLAGEQALLKQELNTLGAEQNRDKQALQNIMSDIGRTNDWHATGTKLLDRLKEREDKMANGHARLHEYATIHRHPIIAPPTGAINKDRATANPSPPPGGLFRFWSPAHDPQQTPQVLPPHTRAGQ